MTELILVEPDAMLCDHHAHVRSGMKASTARAASTALQELRALSGSS